MIENNLALEARHFWSETETLFATVIWLQQNLKVVSCRQTNKTGHVITTNFSTSVVVQYLGG